MEWNELIEPAVEDNDTREMDLCDLFKAPEVEIVDHPELTYLRGLDYGPFINQN